MKLTEIKNIEHPPRCLVYGEHNDVLIVVKNIPELTPAQFKQLVRTSFSTHNANMFLEINCQFKFDDIDWNNTEALFDDIQFFDNWAEAVNYWNEICKDIYGDDFDE